MKIHTSLRLTHHGLWEATIIVLDSNGDLVHVYSFLSEWRSVCEAWLMTHNASEGTSND